METLAAFGTLVAGLAFLTLAYGNLNYERDRRSRGVVVDGVVVGSEWQVNTVEAIYQSPEVEFVDREGTKRRFQQPSGTTARPKVGTPVQVWYDPERPDQPPVIHEDTVTRMIPWVFGLLGLGATVVGGVLIAGLVT